MIALPSNSVIDTAIRLNDRQDNRARIRQLADAERVIDGEDYRVVNTERGPVRGWGGGGRGSL